MEEELHPWKGGGGGKRIIQLLIQFAQSLKDHCRKAIGDIVEFIKDSWEKLWIIIFGPPPPPQEGDVGKVKDEDKTAGEEAVEKPKEDTEKGGSQDKAEKDAEEGDVGKVKDKGKTAGEEAAEKPKEDADEGEVEDTEKYKDKGKTAGEEAAEKPKEDAEKDADEGEVEDTEKYKEEAEKWSEG